MVSEKKEIGKGKQKGKQPQRNNNNHKDNQKRFPHNQPPKELIIPNNTTTTPKNPVHVKTLAATNGKNLLSYLYTGQRNSNIIVLVKAELSDGEIESDTAEHEPKSQVTSTNALSSFLGCYASDSDEAGTSIPTVMFNISSNSNRLF